MRVTWVQPEDLLRHELWQSAREGRDVSAVRERWVAAGGVAEPPYAGASPDVATPAQRELADELLAELDGSPETGADDEPSDWDAIIASLPPDHATAAPAYPLDADRVRGAWMGRAVGCVLGKPVEKIPREGIEAILR